MKKLLYITLFAAIAAFGACQQSGKPANSLTDSTQATAANKAGGSDTVKAYQAYLELKDNLVKTDAKAAHESAEKLVKALLPIEGCAQTADVAREITATSDVKVQRQAFLKLSQDMIPLVKGMKSKPAPVYVAFCPMANEGKGGYWLAAEKEIKNPYYGDQMLECGEVKEEIK